MKTSFWVSLSTWLSAFHCTIPRWPAEPRSHSICQ